MSKNQSGGLKGHKIQPKIVQHHDNPDNPDWCFVELSGSTKVGAHQIDPRILLTPASFQGDLYMLVSNKPVGHNKFEGTVVRLCKAARIPGYCTNHSLRATAATQLNNAGVDEQQVMELVAWREYKATSAPPCNRKKHFQIYWTVKGNKSSQISLWKLLYPLMLPWSNEISLCQPPAVLMQTILQVPYSPENKPLPLFDLQVLAQVFSPCL